MPFYFWFFHSSIGSLPPLGTLHPALRPLVQRAHTRSSCIFLLVTAFFALDIRMRTQVCSTKIASDAAIDFSYSRCFRMFSSKIETEIKSDKIGIPCRPARNCSYFSLSCVLISGSHVQLQSSTHRAGECRQSVLRALLPTERATRVDSALSLGALKRSTSIITTLLAHICNSCCPVPVVRTALRALF